MKVGRRRWFITMDDIDEGPLVKDGLLELRDVVTGAFFLTRVPLRRH